MYNEPKFSEQIVSIHDIHPPLCTIHVLGYIEEIAKLHHLFSHFATNCCVKIALKVTKMHQIFKNVSKL